MIALKRFSGQDFVLNADYIESIESTPDTVITLTSGKKILVKNTLEDIIGKAIRYKQLTNNTLQVIQRTPSETSEKSVIG